MTSNHCPEKKNVPNQLREHFGKQCHYWYRGNVLVHASAVKTTTSNLGGFPSLHFEFTLLHELFDNNYGNICYITNNIILCYTCKETWTIKHVTNPQTFFAFSNQSMISDIYILSLIQKVIHGS